MREAVIVSVARTPVGKAKRGVFRHTRVDDLGRHAVKAAVERAEGLDPGVIEDVVLGCAMPEGEQGLNVARIISLFSGLPHSVPAMTINRFCSSGLQAIAIAAERVMLGHAEVALAGGVETMSHVPMSGFKPSPHPDILLEMPDIYISMGHTAENVAKRFGVSREDQDRFAYESHQKAYAAQQAGKFDDEIVPVETKVWEIDEDGRPHEKAIRVTQDEGVRNDTTPEALATLRPAFSVGGTVTAGNASQMSDGAAAAVIMTAEKAQKLGLKPLATFKSFAVTGCDPAIMGIGPVGAIPKALKLAGLSLSDIDLFEINEAFASQCLQVIRSLDIDPSKVNVNGGAIALGHPLGCTGAKLTATLIHELRRRGGGYGVVSM
uniref:acetyl-CoA C-acyltransferase n=1 Tax=Alicyclobacillus sendaiensis TaxID=192387 RepID=UPI0026F4689D